MVKFIQKNIQRFTNIFYLRGLLKVLYFFRYFFKNRTSEYILKDGKKVFLDLDDYFEGTVLWSFYEISCMHIINSLLTEGDHFIDIGANKGFISLQALSKIGSNGHLFCFEPNPELVRHIKKNIEINSFNNFTIINRPLSNIEEQVKFAIGKQHAFSKIASSNDLKKIEVENYLNLETLTFDKYIHDSVENIKKISLLKIDAEGYDLKIIFGMKKFLSNIKPTIVFEYSDDQSTHLDEFNEIITSFNYEIYLISDNIKGKIFGRKNFKLTKLNVSDLKDIKYSDVLLIHEDNLHHKERLKIYKPI